MYVCVCLENLRYTYTMYTRHSSPSIYVSIYRFAVGCFGVGELGGWLSGAQGRVVVSSLLFLLRCCLKVDKSNGMGWRGVYLQVEEGIMEALLSRVSWLSLSVVCTWYERMVYRSAAVWNDRPIYISVWWWGSRRGGSLAKRLLLNLFIYIYKYNIVQHINLPNFRVCSMSDAALNPSRVFSTGFRIRDGHQERSANNNLANSHNYITNVRSTA